MISTLEQSTTRTAYLDQLQLQLRESDAANPEWLVVAHDDVRLLRCLDGAMTQMNAVCLRVPQSCWDFGDSDLARVIAWAAEETRVSGIILCGHSQYAVAGNLHRRAPTQFAEPKRTSTAQAVPGHGILDRLKRSQDQLRNAKLHFASLVDQLGELSRLCNRGREIGLQVFGLFYLAESGAFLAYDTDTRSFQPLITETAGA